MGRNDASTPLVLEVLLCPVEPCAGMDGMRRAATIAAIAGLCVAVIAGCVLAGHAVRWIPTALEEIRRPDRSEAEKPVSVISNVTAVVVGTVETTPEPGPGPGPKVKAGTAP
jgi:hypothetical protein